MPYALLLFGSVLLVAGVRGKQNVDDLFTLLKGDFTGPGNFIYWTMAILAIGSVGYVKPLRPVSEAFLILVVLALFLSKSHQGFFTQLTQQINTTTQTATTSNTSATPSAATATPGFGAISPTIQAPTIQTPGIVA